MRVRLRDAVFAMICAQVVFVATASADEPFELHSIDTQGRTAGVEMVDVNGDSRSDIVQTVFEGFPPNERRMFRVFLQDREGRIERTPDHTVLVPDGSAGYDIADVLPEPGVEFVMLRPAGVTLLSLARADAPRRDLKVPGDQTIAASEDERGLDRLHIAYDEFGEQTWLIVPQLSQVAALDTQGELMARFKVGARANYFVRAQPGPLVVDSDIQLMLDAPRISVGDVDGDGQADVVSSGRHELRVFLRKADGSFSPRASRVHPLLRVSPKDHIRGSGTVAAEARDIDVDGKADLLISHVSGGLTNANTKTSIYMNRQGSWNLDAPDYEFDSGQGWGSDQLIDVDGDRHLELVHVAIPVSVLEVVELLVTQAIDAKVEVYRRDGDAVFGKEPWISLKLGLPFSFETSRTRGFVPNSNYDFNGDGVRDMVQSGSGDRLEVYLGGTTRLYKQRDGRQELDSAGRFRAGDFNGDRLADFVIYDPRRVDVPVLLGVNRGTLPGTLPQVGARSAPSAAQ